MTRKRTGIAAGVVAAVAIAGWLAGCGATQPNASVVKEQRLQAAEPQVRSAVTRYTELLESVRPVKFYGKQLTPVRCVSFMKGRDAQLEQVAAGEAFTQARSGWSTLAGLIRQEQEFGRSFGAGQIPTACHGEIGYWRVLSGGGDEYVVRAAVLETMDHGRWDAARHALTDTGSFSYSDAMAWDYTLRKVGGVWKVVAVRSTGLSFTRGGHSLHPDDA